VETHHSSGIPLTNSMLPAIKDNAAFNAAFAGVLAGKRPTVFNIRRL
jgi:hypothetical protein